MTSDRPATRRENEAAGRKPYLIVSGLVAACLLGVAFWVGQAFVLAKQTTSFLRWEEPKTVAAGQALYRAHCSACHGIPGVLKPVAKEEREEPAPAHDESGHSWEHPDFALFQLIRDGVAVANCAPVDPQRMPAFKGVLSDPELVAVLSYIKSTWPEDTRAHHDKVNMMYGPYNRAVGELIDIDTGE